MRRGGEELVAGLGGCEGLEEGASGWDLGFERLGGFELGAELIKALEEAVVEELLGSGWLTISCLSSIGEVRSCCVGSVCVVASLQ